MSQTGVLIKDGSGNVIEKRVYAGDVSALDAKLKTEGVNYVILDDMDALFIGAKVISSSVPPLDTRVEKLEKAIMLIAKQMNVSIGSLNG